MIKSLYIRRKLIRLIDTLKGSPVKKNLININDFFENSNFELRHKKTKHQLNFLLNHAISTTDYYKNYASNNSFKDFPVVNKNLIRDHHQAFTSHKFELKKCVKASTSGSTGMPFSIYQNIEKVNKNIADDIFFSTKSNYWEGNHLVYFRVWPNKFTLKRTLNFKMRHIDPCDVFALTNDTIHELITRLNQSKKPVNLKGYVSAFEKICRYIETLPENPIKFKTDSIITTSERVNDYTKDAVKKYFGIWPVSRYSNLENGVIAQQYEGDDPRLWINDSSYLIEIFDLKENKKLNYGEHGRIVLTDLYNFATPMIRYDTGDVGTIELDSENKPYFTVIYGRKKDLIYDTKGHMVPAHLSYKIYKYGDFKQFQLIQKGLKEYEIILNTTIKIDEKDMIEEFQAYFGLDANIKVNYVDDIPLLDSGKRREMVNEYYTNT